jgi:hypothetical protein
LRAATALKNERREPANGSRSRLVSSSRYDEAITVVGRFDLAGSGRAPG